MLTKASIMDSIGRMPINRKRYFFYCTIGMIVLFQLCATTVYAKRSLQSKSESPGHQQKSNIEKPHSNEESVAKGIAQCIKPTHWLYHLIIILLGYSTVIVPLFALVYMVKHQLCFVSVRNNRWVKLFVFGKQHLVIEDEIEAQLLNESNDENLRNAISPRKDATRRGTNKPITLFYCFIGLQLSYLTWGVIQEKIMTTEYTIYRESCQSTHDNQPYVKLMKAETIYFRDSQFLVLVNRILALLFALVAVWLERRKSDLSKKAIAHKTYLIAPLYEFSFCSLSNVLSSWCQYEALKFVNFPTQVLSKACKLLAVMLMSQVVNKKSYKTIEYVFALSITFGMTFFLLGNHRIETDYSKLHINTQEQQHSYHLVDGLVILTLYVTFDAFTSNWQGKLFDKYAIGSCQMMAAVNFYSIMLTATSSAEQGDLWRSVQLLCQCPSLFTDCLLLSICSAAGQLFVFHTISTFGPLVFTIIMTLRQAFAILLSCLIYKHPLSWLSMFGIILVFSTLFYQIHWKQKTNSSRPIQK